jgi:DNA-binding transcriptional MerR regulator
MQQEYTPKQLAWMFGVNCRQLRNFEQQFGALPGKRKTGSD